MSTRSADADPIRASAVRILAIIIITYYRKHNFTTLKKGSITSLNHDITKLRLHLNRAT